MSSNLSWTTWALCAFLDVMDDMLKDVFDDVIVVKLSCERCCPLRVSFV